ncbi:MAG: hypothetical protein IPJ79_16670 [Bacteroidetes bacterium]|nr:hypothetical protein [Bacteroidota bacterium]
MKKTVLTLLGLCFALTIAMGQQDNWMHKYWNYRDRFHKYFTHMGTSPGDGLAAAHRMLRRFDDYAGGANGTNYYNGIKYGDAIADLGDYIAVLATEYKLLKDAGKDLTPVLNELYFALDAFERSDKEAEVYLSNGLQGENSNGFFMRGDVPANYHTIWNNEYANTNDEADLRLPGTDAPGHYTGEFSGYINDGNEMSHDQVIGLLVGFCFVKKFVDNVSVCPRPGTDTPRNLVTQVEDITNRVLDFTKATKNYEQYSPTTACGTRHRTIHLNWDMKNPVTGEMVQSDGGHSQVFAYPFECTRGFITGTYGNTDLYAHLRYDYSGTFCPTIGGDLTVPYPISVWNAIPSTVYFNPWAVTIHIDVCINNIPLVNLVTQVFDQDEDICFTLLPVTFAVDDYNINMILSLASTAGNSQLNWNHSEIASIADNVDMEIFDLVYATLHDVAPLLSKSHYEQILSSAPEDGPYWYDAGDYSPGWIANSRWSHPHEVPYNNDNFKGGKSGNDYMWLYNLYRIAYAAYPDVASVNYGEQNTCAYQSCPAIFKNITGTDLTAPTTVTRKFQNYMDFGVTIKEYLNQSLNINPVNDLNVLTELVVCNNTGGQSIVHVQNGGHLILGEPTGDNYKKGILRVSAGHKLVLKSGSTLTINDKSQVIIEPGAYIEIEPDVVIELAGADAKLDIQGTLNPITLTATHSLTITKATASVGGTAIFPNGGLHLQTNSNLYITGCTLYVEVNCPFSMEHDVNIELSDATALLEVKSNLNNINLTTGQSINVHKAASATTGGTAKFKNGSITMNNGSNVTSDFCKVYFDNTDFHYHLGSVFYINAEEALIDIKHSNYEEITLQNTDIYRVERTTEAIGGTLNLTSTSTDNGGAPSKFTHNGGGQVYSKNCRIYLNNYDYYYHPNANINLDGDMASLRFGRYVYLQPTANLTFSGTGYLGFNLIQNWGTYKNVIGDNSNTITLIGSGKTDKIVEVTSSHWVNPMDAISLITIKNGRVEFGSNALISIGSDYEYRNLEVGRIGWQWPQGTVPYGYGSGFMVGGQNVATMEDIDFYGLDFPIRAYSFWTQGADFTASNITFNNCYNGLIAWGKGFHLYNLGGSYVDNIVIGNGMETPSNIENAQYYQAETRFPVYYNTAGTSSLTIRHSTLAGDISDVSSYQGPRNSIKYEGGGLLNIRCSEINSIGDMFAGAWDNSIGMKISRVEV